MKITHLPSPVPNGFLEASQGYTFGCRVLARLAERTFSVGSGKGDIEFP